MSKIPPHIHLHSNLLLFKRNLKEQANYESPTHIVAMDFFFFKTHEKSPVARAFHKLKHDFEQLDSVGNKKLLKLWFDFEKDFHAQYISSTNFKELTEQMLLQLEKIEQQLHVDHPRYQPIPDGSPFAKNDYFESDLRLLADDVKVHEFLNENCMVDENGKFLRLIPLGKIDLVKNPNIQILDGVYEVDAKGNPIKKLAPNELTKKMLKERETLLHKLMNSEPNILIMDSNSTSLRQFFSLPCRVDKAGNILEILQPGALNSVNPIELKYLNGWYEIDSLGLPIKKIAPNFSETEPLIVERFEKEVFRYNKEEGVWEEIPPAGVDLEDPNIQELNGFYQVDKEGRPKKYLAHSHDFRGYLENSFKKILERDIGVKFYQTLLQTIVKKNFQLVYKPKEKEQNDKSGNYFQGLLRQDSSFRNSNFVKFERSSEGSYYYIDDGGERRLALVQGEIVLDQKLSHFYSAPTKGVVDNEFNATFFIKVHEELHALHFFQNPENKLATQKTFETKDSNLEEQWTIYGKNEAGETMEFSESAFLLAFGKNPRKFHAAPGDVKQALETTLFNTIYQNSIPVFLEKICTIESSQEYAEALSRDILNMLNYAIELKSDTKFIELLFFLVLKDPVKLPSFISETYSKQTVQKLIALKKIMKPDLERPSKIFSKFLLTPGKKVSERIFLLKLIEDSYPNTFKEDKEFERQYLNYVVSAPIQEKNVCLRMAIANDSLSDEAIVRLINLNESFFSELALQFFPEKISVIENAVINCKLKEPEKYEFIENVLVLFGDKITFQKEFDGGVTLLDHIEMLSQTGEVSLSSKYYTLLALIKVYQSSDQGELTKAQSRFLREKKATVKKRLYTPSLNTNQFLKSNQIAKLEKFISKPFSGKELAQFLLDNEISPYAYTNEPNDLLYEILKSPNLSREAFELMAFFYDNHTKIPDFVDEMDYYIRVELGCLKKTEAFTFNLKNGIGYRIMSQLELGIGKIPLIKWTLGCTTSLIDLAYNIVEGSTRSNISPELLYSSLGATDKKLGYFAIQALIRGAFEFLISELNNQCELILKNHFRLLMQKNEFGRSYLSEILKSMPETAQIEFVKVCLSKISERDLSHLNEILEKRDELSAMFFQLLLSSAYEGGYRAQIDLKLILFKVIELNPQILVYSANSSQTFLQRAISNFSIKESSIFLYIDLKFHLKAESLELKVNSDQTLSSHIDSLFDFKQMFKDIFDSSSKEIRKELLKYSDSENHISIFFDIILKGNDLSAEAFAALMYQCYCGDHQKQPELRSILLKFIEKHPQVITFKDQRGKSFLKKGFDLLDLDQVGISIYDDFTMKIGIKVSDLPFDMYLTVGDYLDCLFDFKDTFSLMPEGVKEVFLKNQFKHLQSGQVSEIVANIILDQGTMSSDFFAELMRQAFEGDSDTISDCQTLFMDLIENHPEVLTFKDSKNQSFLEKGVGLFANKASLRSLHWRLEISDEDGSIFNQMLKDDLSVSQYFKAKISSDPDEEI